MKDTLYRIEPAMRLENPELSGSVMITCNGGVLFAELHPVKIKAKKKEPCEYCAEPKMFVRADTDRGHTATNAPRHCFNCGRQLTEEG